MEDAIKMLTLTVILTLSRLRLFVGRELLVRTLEEKVREGNLTFLLIKYL